MSVPTVLMSVDELERMRRLLRKVEEEKIPLTAEEQEELRGYVARDRPEEAKGADMKTLIFLGLALLGLYVSILLLDRPKGGTNITA